MTALWRAFKFEPAEQFAALRTALALFGVRGWSLALLGAIATFVVIGIPASLIENPIFDRQIAARPQDYVIWVMSAALGGLIIGTFALAPIVAGQGKAATGGVLTVIAVGCPVCNQAAVLLLGTSGALNVFGPSQLYIGLASLILLGWTLLIRAQAVVGACPTAPSEQGTREDRAPQQR
ncbi:MAG: hypothetical protein GEU80_00415 [Dehalococcoidia bacterium]|nr:hypothetical protein [Dehalococcoidia bacterium]